VLANHIHFRGILHTVSTICCEREDRAEEDRALSGHFARTYVSIMEGRGVKKAVPLPAFCTASALAGPALVATTPLFSSRHLCARGEAHVINVKQAISNGDSVEERTSQSALINEGEAGRRGTSMLAASCKTQAGVGMPQAEGGRRLDQAHLKKSHCLIAKSRGRRKTLRIAARTSALNKGGASAHLLVARITHSSGVFAILSVSSR